MSSVEIIKRKGSSVYLMEPNGNQYAEYFDSLTDAEKVRLESIHHPSRRLEFLASRFLRTAILGQKSIEYFANGAPYIENQGFISISHTTGLVGLAHSEQFSVGLDLECIREKAARLHQRFTHREEYAQFDPSSAVDMTILWSMKETLYKLGHRKGVHFATELLIDRINDSFKGSITHPDSVHSYPLFLHRVNNIVVTSNDGKPDIRYL